MMNRSILDSKKEAETRLICLSDGKVLNIEEYVRLPNKIGGVNLQQVIFK
jgi:hypothetical protein